MTSTRRKRTSALVAELARGLDRQIEMGDPHALALEAIADAIRRDFAAEPNRKKQKEARGKLTGLR